MVLTVEKKKFNGRETCHSANLSITNIKWTGLGSNPMLRDVRLVAIDPSRVTTNRRHKLYDKTVLHTAQ